MMTWCLEDFTKICSKDAKPMNLKDYNIDHGAAVGFRKCSIHSDLADVIEFDMP
jgi:hypothetical protein